MILLITVLLLAAAAGGGCYAYAEGYLDDYKDQIDPILMKIGIIDGASSETEEPAGNEKVKPDDYELPTMTYKEEYAEGKTVIRENEQISLWDLVDIECSDTSRSSLRLELENEAAPDYKNQGIHTGKLIFRDYYGETAELLIVIETVPEETTEEEIEEVKQKTGHYEEREEVVEAYDEQVMTRAAYTEKVLASDAWDETIEYCSAMGYDKENVYICGGCHQQFSASEIDAHIDASTEDVCGSYSGQYVDVGERHCLAYDSYVEHHDAVYDYVYHEAEYKTVHHDAETKTISHPAEYEYIEHPAEYETVHHEATTKTVMVWVED